MGLLTDPAGLHGRPFRFLVNNQGKLCFLLYFSSIFWYLLLASEQINAGTYLSENALLPGLVTVGCEIGPQVKAIAAELDSEAASRGDGGGIPSAWVRAKLLQAGVQPYTHNFTLNYPLGRGTKYSGKNVYGIIPGGGAGTESIVLSVPYRPPGSVHPSTAPGLALLLALGGCFRKQKYWAKDVILLVTEHEQLGMHAWLEAYHGTTCGSPGVVEAGELLGRGGGIQAALNLELHSMQLRSLDVKLSGLNGQLPNLDLANLVHRIASKERVRHTFANREKVHNMPLFEQWYQSLETMTSMVLTQASGVPDGNHGLFHRFGIEAVTLEGHSTEYSGPYVPLNQIARVIEGVFRSVNNLLERFHQSYFFYLLVDTDRFASIGLYMVCIGLLIGALFVKAFSFYLNLKALLQTALMDNSEGTKPELPELNAVGSLVAVLVSYATGLVASNSAQLFTRVAPLATDESLFLGYAGLTCVTVFGPPFVLRRWKGGKEWILLTIASIVNLGTLLIAVAMHNFSLAFIAGIAVVPVALAVGPSRNGFLKKALTLCVHPMSLLLLIVAASAVAHFPTDAVLGRTLTGAMQALALSVVDSTVYGSWTFGVATVFYLPNWMMLWIAVHAERSVLDEAETIKED